MSNDEDGVKGRLIIQKLELAEEAIKKDLHRFEDTFFRDQDENVPVASKNDDSAFFNSYGTAF
jgi:hypothetical protein